MFIVTIYAVLLISAIFIIIYIFLILTNRKIMIKINDAGSIKDLEFIKDFINFMYKSNMVDKMETIMSGLKNRGDIQSLSGTILPEMESEIIDISIPLRRYETLKLKYEELYSVSKMFMYFIIIYSAILIAINILRYRNIFGSYSFYDYYLLGFFYSVFALFIFTGLLIIIYYILHYYRITRLIESYYLEN